MSETILYIPLFVWLAAVGIWWGGTSMYLIRLQEVAKANGQKSLSEYFDAFTYAVELTVAGFIGFLGAITAYHLGLADPVVVAVGSVASFLNKSAVTMLIESAPVLFERLLSATKR